MKRFCILLMALCLHVFAAHAQQVFTIDGYVDEEIADSCHNIYLGDEYFKIQDEPVATVPIVNKRVSVTPISLVGGATSPDGYVKLAHPLQRAADTLGINFLGGFSALVQKGMTNKEIAESLCLSIHTVITHRRNIARKLQIHSPAGLTIYAIVNKLVELNDIKL